ncbi:bifunctional 3-oxoadipate enol-lactonase/4-carboxymuconolactone decarboxylase PcaDC [Nocardia higoensis]|uniref:bifunctional 3-oxoadipate enol-lactonase/4-carboxymuconolactone decarboxylase PcaDC n=1 Tax=Nocardia higoensis TaxID=228599 RepID=UPI0002D3EBE7|nr:4-carboxymuconolactone decarboxylase [Nocardia higoensis]
MTIPAITGVQLGGSAELPLLVCGPSLGTSAVALWSAAAELLGEHFHVIGWDLPGHGHNTAEITGGFTMAELAEGVRVFVDGVLAERGTPGGSFVYAGDSVGGCVGQQLLLDHPARITAAVLACTAARIGDEAMWRERAELVRGAGTPVMVEGSAKRWFAPGFVDAHPERAVALLHSLQHTDRHGYAAVCQALATFDVRAELQRIDTPVVALAGAYDQATPVAAMAELAHGVGDGRLIVLDRVAHLAPAEAPADTARIILRAAGIESARVGPEADAASASGGSSLAGAARAADGAAGLGDPGTLAAGATAVVESAKEGDSRTIAERRAAGMAVRRAVLGDEHVDRATAAITDLTREFQEFITDYAWGGIWTRPGLDRRSRSVAVLTALIARGHHEELAMHLRAARTNGLTDDEIKEVILQSAIYCGVPDANTAFRIARQTLTDPDARNPR